MRTLSKLGTAVSLSVSLFTWVPAAHALTATGNFDVQVNLYPKCVLTAPSALQLHYVSFQTTASTRSADVNVKCTNGLPYTVSLGGSSGNSGSLVGLNYTVSLDTPGGTGNGNDQAIALTGTVAANQSGTCTTSQGGTSGTQVASTTGNNTGAAMGTACSGTSVDGAHVLTVTY
ncbi:MAG: spore coat protein U domain-containing protein [Limnohabitans sp.]